ncbi:MAG: hypothetical protein CFE41_17325 [Burkholderiales bacterium PBB2]|nr:MAG: hypothetical protein CFE41_17325 [Burkholderiales bacterium PBB2]
MVIGLHREGKLVAAETLYRRLMQLQPDDANAQNFLGMLLYQRGEPAERDEAANSGSGLVSILFVLAKTEMPKPWGILLELRAIGG